MAFEQMFSPAWLFATDKQSEGLRNHDMQEKRREKALLTG